jgi:hypothetical protein
MTAASRAWRDRLQAARASPVLVPALAATSVGAIVGLTVLRVTDAPWITHALGQIIFLVSFASLAIVDFRASVAIAMIELAVYGAGGHWTQFAGGPSGRIVLDGIVVVRALAILGAQWRRTGRLELGRYGPHAVFLAVVIPGVWMTLGLVNGNRPGDVFADGNGLAFFAFTIVLTVLLYRGQASWLRHWLLVACAVSAVVTGLLILITASGMVPMDAPLRQALLEQLSFGGNFGYLPNGAYRLYLGSGIYLQVGLALTTWQLLSGRPRVWPWALYGLLWADVLATYTRGFWIGSALAVGLTLAMGASNLRRPVAIFATSVLIFVFSSGAGSLVGFSLPDYVLNRTASTLSTGPSQAATPTAQTGTVTQPGTVAQPSATSSPVPTPGRDIAGEVSNEVRVEQIRVLVGHIEERPVVGRGFGSIAADYQYGQIYSYELAYLDLLFKTGVVGLVLFLTFPIRLLLDAMRGRLGRLSVGPGVTPRATSVVVAIVVPLLVTGGTNPYLLAAFGLFPILATIAWLDPSGGDDAATHSH